MDYCAETVEEQGVRQRQKVCIQKNNIRKIDEDSIGFGLFCYKSRRHCRDFFASYTRHCAGWVTMQYTEARHFIRKNSVWHGQKRQAVSIIYPADQNHVLNRTGWVACGFKGSI